MLRFLLVLFSNIVACMHWQIVQHCRRKCSTALMMIVTQKGRVCMKYKIPIRGCVSKVLCLEYGAVL